MILSTYIIIMILIMKIVWIGKFFVMPTIKINYQLVISKTQRLNRLEVISTEDYFFDKKQLQQQTCTSGVGLFSTSCINCCFCDVYLKFLYAKNVLERCILFLQHAFLHFRLFCNHVDGIRKSFFANAQLTLQIPTFWYSLSH